MKAITATVQLLFFLATSAQAFVSPRQAPTAFVVPTSKPVLNSAETVQRLVSSSANQRQQCGVLFMGWGPDPVWSAAEVKTNEAANQSGKSVSITVSVPPETAGEYKIPGQYVQFRLNEDDAKPLFLAVSSAPNAENAEFEFLIKKTPDNGWITDAAPGTKVEVSQVLGGGFPMQEHLEGFKYDFPTQNILLFGVGSGIAPIKAAMESGKF
jgi:hypothetical protein